MTQSNKPQQQLRWLALAVSIALAGVQAATPGTKDPDHFEFDATLDAPYGSVEPGGARRFTLHFNYPGARYLQTVAWRLELLSPNGTVLQRWQEESAYQGKPLAVDVDWAGRSGAANLADGIYQLRMSSTIADPVLASTIAGDKTTRVERMLALARGHDLKQQSWDIRLGSPTRPALPRFSPLPTTTAAGVRPGRAAMRMAAAPAANALPYTIYYGNLHSQTNDSDGGGAVETCSSSQPAQTGQFGPADAYAYADQHGLDFLMTSEHNHYFDGSSGTNATASPVAAHNRYQAGLTSAASYSASHGNFLALYGMEWGVISNGGHLNIFNSDMLLGWEYNGSQQLLADRFTAKSDYQALYTLMKQQGWIGQFNHPETSSQFLVGGKPLGYSADGDAVMVLAEILNTSAFSSNTTETETGRSNYEAAFNLMLERGFHVAPASNQDNHCANWGASYSNRTAVLLPNGTPLNQANFLDALRARRVFATMDKQSQLILTANSHLMGERFSNAGPLQLSANFANSAGRSVAQAQLFEGVPGRNGSVSLLASQASTSFTPSVGEHFYYAKLTQDDGKILWSAPVWVSQTSDGGGGGTDTTPPQASAAVTVSGGTIQLSASASDDVGVKRVDFLIDKLLKGSDDSAPYSLALDAATLANGSHSLVARAYDAAGNMGESTNVGFTVNNSQPDTQAPTVTAAVAGSSGNITLSANAQDNVGVSGVDFLVDGVLKGSDAGAPFTIALDSTTLADGSHNLVARAFDAAGNSGVSPALAFNIGNGGGTVAETEPNGSLAGANALSHNQTRLSGTMGNSKDLDYYKLTLSPFETLRVDMVGPSGKDYDLYLLNGSGAQLAASESDTANESLSYSNGAASQTVYIKVSSYAGSSTTKPYSLTLAYTARPVAAGAKQAHRNNAK